MIRISDISFFCFCWKNGKLDWPECARTRNNSTKQKGKKISTSHYQSKLRAQRYGDKLQKTMESLEEKKAVHTSCKHGFRRICQLYTILKLDF